MVATLDTSDHESIFKNLVLGNVVALCLVSDGLAQSARPQFVDNADLKAAAKKQSQLRYAEALDCIQPLRFPTQRGISNARTPRLQ